MHTEITACLAVAQEGRDRKRVVCHPQKHSSTLEWNRPCQALCLLVVSRKHHCLCFASFHFSNTSLLSALCLGCAGFAFRMMFVTPSLEPERQEWGLIRLWAHQGSQWAPESKTLCSAWCIVCLPCNYTDSSAATVDTSTRKGFTMERTNRDAHLCTTMDSKPSSLVLLFVMIGWTRETSQTGYDKLSHHSSSWVFLCACVVL